ncbi:MAG: RNB domain-containing ribonuclease [Candidatus Altiarchaeota archaeon]
MDLGAIARQAMAKYGFDSKFPAAAAGEALSIVSEAGSSENSKDLNRLLWSSIDNSDSQDLDQLEYCEQGQDGEILVRVAIADVDCYVKKGSKLDEYAAHNGTSVYTGVEVFPLFPDRLSKGLTSLLPNQERRAMVIEYSVLPDGRIRPGGISRATVMNKSKLVYEEVGDWLEGKGPMPHQVEKTPGLKEQLRLQDEASRRLKKYRMDSGALEFDTIEAKPLMEDGHVKDLIIQRKNRARCIIEDFMVAANGAMVGFLEKAGVPMIQRVVRSPRDWKGIVDAAAAYGTALPPQPDSKALSEFLDRRKEADPERFPDLSVTVVKLLGPGEYVTQEPGKAGIGHFSLAVTDYTHATAPNRRYVDLIVQRLVKAVIDKKPAPYSLKELVDEAAWLTDREKGSKKVERYMRKSAAAVMLQGRIGETFEALVTGASEKGTYARLLSPSVEGRIIRGEKGLRIGDRIRVRLTYADPYKAYIDFEYPGGRR